MYRGNTKNTFDKWHFPHIGQRIVKTTIAVFLCLLIYYLRGYSGQGMPTESAITAIICMQPYVRDTRTYAINRMTGTLIGAAWGLIFLLLLLVFPALGANPLCLYATMALGVLISLYSAVLVGKADTSSLAAMVFLCIVISFPDIDAPLQQTMNRILDIFIGVLVAVSVNIFRLPREKQRDRVFFIRAKDLVADHLSQISPAVRFRLNYLYDDGAKICIMSEHAPAFFTLQMSAAKLSVPLIVMDGAAIYDANENHYLYTATIAETDSTQLRARLNTLGISYFIYTIHNNKACIFHQGEINEQERTIYDRLRRSPYRNYLDGEIYDPNEIVYFKIIAEDRKIAEIEYSLRKALPRGKLRTAIRPQPGAPGISGLYIYSHAASMAQAQKHMMQLLHQEDPTLTPVEIRLRAGYRSEHDAMHLLTTLGNSYEPIKLFRKKKA